MAHSIQKNVEYFFYNVRFHKLTQKCSFKDFFFRRTHIKHKKSSNCVNKNNTQNHVSWKCQISTQDFNKKNVKDSQLSCTPIHLSNELQHVQWYLDLN